MFLTAMLCEKGLTLSQTNQFFTSQQSFENTVGKGETARNEQFLHFSQSQNNHHHKTSRVHCQVDTRTSTLTKHQINEMH